MTIPPFGPGDAASLSPSAGRPVSGASVEAAPMDPDDDERHAIDNPTPEWRVLASGRMCCRLPDGPNGRERWLCAVTRRRCCPHGNTGSWINNRTCRKNPRAREPWSNCTCEDARGLYTDPAKTPTLPDAPPSYASILWRDHRAVTLYPTGIRAVEVPGRPKGNCVFIDSAGVRRCRHGHSAGKLRAFERERRHRAASILQCWWRRLAGAERLAVRQVLLHCLAARAASLPPAYERHGAMATFAACCLERRAIQWRRALEYKRNGGKPRYPCCGCSSKGLDVELHATGKRARDDKAYGARDGGRVLRSPCAVRSPPL